MSTTNARKNGLIITTGNENDFQYKLSNMDLKGFYYKLLVNYGEFPEVVVVDEIEDGSDIMAKMLWNGNYIYYLKYSNNMYDVLTEEFENSRANVALAYPFEQHSLEESEIGLWITIAVTIADILGVRCPQIVFNNSDCEASNATGHGLIALPSIHPTSKSNILEMFVTIAHELRHEWQHIYHQDWFDDYVYVKSDADLDKYVNHKTEIDAESFARKLIGAALELDLFFGNDPKLIKKMKKRANEIEEIELSEIDKSLFWDTLYEID